MLLNAHAGSRMRRQPMDLVNLEGLPNPCSQPLVSSYQKASSPLDGVRMLVRFRKVSSKARILLSHHRTAVQSKMYEVTAVGGADHIKVDGRRCSRSLTSLHSYKTILAFQHEVLHRLPHRRPCWLCSGSPLHACCACPVPC